jgi:hypothetical protein
MNFSPIQACMVYERQPNRPYGSGTASGGVSYMRLGRSLSGDERKAKFWDLFQFPALPPGAYLQSAILQLYCPKSVYDAPDNEVINSSTIAVPLKVQVIQSAWSVDAVTWNSRPSLDSITYPGLTAPAGAYPKTLSFDVTAVLRAQLDTGLGFAIIPGATGSGHVGINRSDNTQALPYLSVTYEPAMSTGLYINLGEGVKPCAAYAKPLDGSAVKKAKSFTFQMPDGSKYTV